MEKLHARWKKQMDDFDGAVDALPSLERGVRVWGALSPALPALYDAMMREVASYKETAGELRGWLAAHDKDSGDPAELGRFVLATIEAARRVKGLVDAFNREQAVADAAYPEMAGGSLKETGVAPAMIAAAEAKPAEKGTNGQSVTEKGRDAWAAAGPGPGPDLRSGVPEASPRPGAPRPVDAATRQ